MSIPIIAFESVAKSFSGRHILSGLDMSLVSGEVYGLVGLNGAGKTTLLRLALGLLVPDNGAVTIFGTLSKKVTPALYCRVGAAFEHSGFYENLPVLENLRFFAEAKNISASALKMYWDQHWADTDIGRDVRPVKYFSRGQKVQCGLARAFLGEPDLLLLDEPAAALDFLACSKLSALVRQAAIRGAAVIISSHQLDVIADLCSCAGLLENGRITPVVAPRANHVRHLRTATPDDDRTSVETVVSPVSSLQWNGSEFIFTASDEETAMIISRLVHANVQICEVRSVNTGLRGRIENHFVVGGA